MSLILLFRDEAENKISVELTRMPQNDSRSQKQFE
jgi:hypothetical protein